MRQAALQLKMSIGNVNTMSNNVLWRRSVLRTMLVTLVGLALLYLLILGNMVFNIVERRALEKEALALSNDVGNLELTYLSLSKSIDKNLSLSMGFKETKTVFATAIRKSVGSITLANNEI